MRLKRLILATTLLTLSTSFISMAGTWKKGVSRPNDWWYDNGNGTYPYSKWEWLDGNNDGVAECYYFDENGWMLANTSTPDGYRVNADGAWVENGAVQTKTVSTGREQSSKGATRRAGAGRSSSGGGSSSGSSGNSGSGSQISGSTNSNVSTGENQTSSVADLPQVKELTAQGLTVNEAHLYLLINDYRVQQGLPILSFSKSLTEVARAHVQDSNNYHPENQLDSRGEKGNLHSWSANGTWTPVVYTSDHLYADKMWSKPSELTRYTAPGYEISAYSTNMTPEKALDLWMNSSAHNNVIISNGQWSNLTTMGVGISGNYAHVWFGEAADPAGYYTFTQ